MTTKRPARARAASEETAPLTKEPAPLLAVHFVDEPERDPVLIDRALRIGRDAECEIRLDVDSVSRLHAVLEPGHPPRARDAGSRHGTFVGTVRLGDGDAAPAPLGTSIRVGETWLVVGPARNPVRRKNAGPSESSAARGPSGSEISVDLVTKDGGASLLRAVEGPMARVFDLADKLALDDIAVLLTGETGVGKEVVARYLHERSNRKNGPFVPVHAAALSPSLFESELFGHERGAFTGAHTERPGLFEQADGGTLFFDEIGELPLDMQPKLLRVLEDRRVTRVGGLRAHDVDVRIVAATNRDLSELTARGAFRSDLYFRLNAFPIVVPPLRDRGAELVALSRALVERAARERGREPPLIDDDATELLLRQTWPGNVRELRSVLTRAVIFATDRIDEAAIQTALAHSAPQPNSHEQKLGMVADSDASSNEERQRILDALARHAGNQAKAAQALGIARRTLLYKLDRLGIARPRKGSS